MPIRSPSYEIPSFPPTGNEEIDSSLEQWRDSFGRAYEVMQQERERLPYLVSADRDFGAGGISVAGSQTLAREIQLQGGENVHVFGFFDFQVSGSDPGASEQASGKLRITYPGGSVFNFSARKRATLQARFQRTASSAGTHDHSTNLDPDGGHKHSDDSTVFVRANVGYSWPITPRFQSGGAHTFQLRTTGTGTVRNMQLLAVVT